MSAESDFESSTEAYAARFAGEVGAAMLERQSALIQRAVREFLAHRVSTGAGPVSVLDVGGGHGQVLSALSEQPEVELHLLVSSADAVGCAAPLVTSGRVKVHIAQLAQTNLPDRSFEVVTCFRQIPHVADWRRLVQEMARLAAGRVIVDYPPWLSVNVLSGVLFPLKKRLEGNTRPFRLFTHTEIDAEFLNAGFSRAWREGQFLLPLALYRMLKSARLMRLLELPGAACGLRRIMGNPSVSVLDRSPTVP